MLSDAEIVRRLRAIRQTPASERYGRRSISINATAKAVGVSRMQVYRYIKGETIGRRVRQELSRFLACHDESGAGRCACDRYYH